MSSLTEIAGSMKALRNVTSVTAVELPQLSTLSLRAALLSVNEVDVRNAGVLEKSRELEEGMKKMKQNEDKESSERVKRNTKKTKNTKNTRKKKRLPRLPPPLFRSSLPLPDLPAEYPPARLSK